MTDVLARLDKHKALLLVIDLQDKLLPTVQERQHCLQGSLKMLQGAQVLGLPVVVTEQYPAGLGPTCAEIKNLVPTGLMIAKTQFSACTPEVMQAIAGTGRRQIILVGIETHVCVQHTALDLLRERYEVWVCADAVSSRRPMDREVALTRMQHAGVVVTTVESVIFELLQHAGSPHFKSILKIVK